jgi:hypothetical protein
MNLKSFVIGAAIGVTVVVGGVCIYTNNLKKGEAQKEIVNSSIEEKYSIVKEERKILEIISSEKKYQEEYNTENYEVVVKNTSGEYLKRVEFSLGEGIYELYDMIPDEEYKFVAYNTEEEINLKVISTDYEIINYYPDEVSLSITNDGKNVTGSIKNNGERDLYPSQIIFFMKDGSGNTVQKTIEYAGCFFEDLVIKPESTLDFESEIPDGYSFNNSKNVIVRYSDTEFKSVDTIFFD